MNRKTMSIAFAAAIVIPFASVGTAFACHPQGVITKTVQNITAGTAVSDANSAKDAISAKPGDTLRYTITIKNTAASNTQGADDMLNTVMTDTLPDGVMLVGDTSTRAIHANFGTVASGKSVTKTYDVTVTSSADKAIIKNKACYTGDSKLSTGAQSGCDEADVIVSAPPVAAPTPVTPVTPAAAQTTPQPERLPNTGVGGNIMFIGLITTIFGYLGSRLYIQKFGH